MQELISKEDLKLLSEKFKALFFRKLQQINEEHNYAFPIPDLTFSCRPLSFFQQQQKPILRFWVNNFNLHTFDVVSLNNIYEDALNDLKRRGYIKDYKNIAYSYNEAEFEILLGPNSIHRLAFVEPEQDLDYQTVELDLDESFSKPTAYDMIYTPNCGWCGLARTSVAPGITHGKVLYSPNSVYSYASFKGKIVGTIYIYGVKNLPSSSTVDMGNYACDKYIQTIIYDTIRNCWCLSRIMKDLSDYSSLCSWVEDMVNEFSTLDPNYQTVELDLDESLTEPTKYDCIYTAKDGWKNYAEPLEQINKHFTCNYGIVLYAETSVYCTTNSNISGKMYARVCIYNSEANFNVHTSEINANCVEKYLYNPVTKIWTIIRITRNLSDYQSLCSWVEHMVDQFSEDYETVELDLDEQLLQDDYSLPEKQEIFQQCADDINNLFLESDIDYGINDEYDDWFCVSYYGSGYDRNSLGTISIVRGNNTEQKIYDIVSNYLNSKGINFMYYDSLILEDESRFSLLDTYQTVELDLDESLTEGELCTYTIDKGWHKGDNLRQFLDNRQSCGYIAVYNTSVIAHVILFTHFFPIEQTDGWVQISDQVWERCTWHSEGDWESVERDYNFPIRPLEPNSPDSLDIYNSGKQDIADEAKSWVQTLLGSLDYKTVELDLDESIKLNDYDKQKIENQLISECINLQKLNNIVQYKKETHNLSESSGFKQNNYQDIKNYLDSLPEGTRIYVDSSDEMDTTERWFEKNSGKFSLFATPSIFTNTMWILDTASSHLASSIIDWNIYSAYVDKQKTISLYDAIYNTDNTNYQTVELDLDESLDAEKLEQHTVYFYTVDEGWHYFSSGKLAYNTIVGYESDRQTYGSIEMYGEYLRADATLFTKSFPVEETDGWIKTSPYIFQYCECSADVNKETVIRHYIFADNPVDRLDIIKEAINWIEDLVNTTSYQTLELDLDESNIF